MQLPELPEVETMVRNIGPSLFPYIIDVDISRNNGRYLPDDELKLLKQDSFERVFRRGKFIVFVMKNGMLVSHNAMSGYWDTEEEPWTFDYVEGKREADSRDVRVWIAVGMSAGKGETRTLRFHDARLFGSLRYYPTHDMKKITCLNKLGPDILDDDAFRSMLDASQRKRTPIKQLLMNQDVIAGLGNIYVAEALWHAGIHPERPASSLTRDEVHFIYGCCVHVVLHAINEKLDYKKYLKVYRQGACQTCGGEIRKIDVAKRSTYFCPDCQK